MGESADFTVKVTGRRCEIIGHLADATPVEEYESEFRVCKEFDLSQLYSVSWVGLYRLVTFLERIGTRGSLLNVPSHVHRIMILMSEFSSALCIGSVEVEARAPRGKGIVKAVVEFDELVNNGLLRGAFVALEHPGFLLDSLHVLCRPAFRNTRLPRPNFARNWCESAPGESMFWYEYCYFVRMSIESSALVLGSAVRLVEDSLQDMFQRISAAESFAKVVHPDARRASKGRLLLDLLARLNEMGHACVDELTCAREPFRDVCHTLISVFVDRGGTQARVYEAVAEMANALHSLRSLTGSLDAVGSETSQGLFEFQEQGGILPLLRSMDGSEVTDEKLAAARRKAKFPVEAGVGWNATVIELERHVSVIDQDVEKCLVALQCYDSLRQVLEHRLDEAASLSVIIPEVRAGTRTFEQAKERLLGKASAKLATDQEKFAFEFFFPEEYVIRRNMASGEIAFFDTTKVSVAEGEVVKEAS